MAELRSCVSESRGGRPGLPVPNSPNYGLSGRKAMQNLNQTWQHRRIRHTYSTWGSCDQFLRLVQQNTDRTRPGRPRPRRLGARGVCGGGVGGGVGGWGLGGGGGTQIKTCRSIQRLQRCRSAPVHSTDTSSGKLLQALVYDILPSTTTVFSYAIGSRKLSANEQFFCWCSNSSMSVTKFKVYTSTNKTTIV